MCKNYKSFILIFVVTFISLTATIAYSDHVCGDANSDGLLNVSDAVFLINYIFVGGDAPDPTCCEFDCPSTVTDIDGNIYATTRIGDQCWMARNLEVTHYRNGDTIPNVTDGSAWPYLTTGAQCGYNNNEGNIAVYGRLYNWYAVDDSRNIAPEGWHVPSDAEWQILIDYLGGSEIAGGMMKETGTAHWTSPNGGATNCSGFTALPGGHRGHDFVHMGNSAYFWSSTLSSMGGRACYRMIMYNDAGIDPGNGLYYGGFSVRCIKD
jgi:uncharacterized protein (TIGR02145 family)